MGRTILWSFNRIRHSFGDPGLSLPVAWQRPHGRFGGTSEEIVRGVAGCARTLQRKGYRPGKAQREQAQSASRSKGGPRRPVRQAPINIDGNLGGCRQPGPQPVIQTQAANAVVMVLGGHDRQGKLAGHLDQALTGKNLSRGDRMGTNACFRTSCWRIGWSPSMAAKATSCRTGQGRRGCLLALTSYISATSAKSPVCFSHFYENEQNLCGTNAV